MVEIVTKAGILHSEASLTDQSIDIKNRFLLKQ